MAAPGEGLIDNALGLVDQIGVPVPGGDTDKIDRAAQAWDKLATDSRTTAVVSDLETLAGRFSYTKTPEVDLIAKDLGELHGAARAILDGCAELAQSCKDYKSAGGNRLDRELAERELVCEKSRKYREQVHVRGSRSC